MIMLVRFAGRIFKAFIISSESDNISLRIEEKYLFMHLSPQATQANKFEFSVNVTVCRVYMANMNCTKKMANPSLQLGKYIK